MQNILVIADQEDKQLSALNKGFEFADASGANLDIVSFCHANLGGLAARGDMDTKDVKQLIVQKRETHLLEAIATLRAKFPQLEAREVSAEVVWEHNIHEWITQRASDQPYDLLIKTGHRSETLTYTSTDFHLMRESPAPVYLVSEKPWKTKRRVLVAIDIETSQPEKQQLNLHLLEAGRLIADTFNAELACCFVIHVPKLLKEFDLVDISTYAKRAREEFLPRATRLVKPFGITPDNIHRAAGEPAGEILSISSKLKPGCLVIGSVGREGVAGKLIGNTAEEVIKWLRSDMLVVNHA